MAKSKRRPGKGYDGGGSVTVGGNINAAVSSNVRNALMLQQAAKLYGGGPGGTPNSGGGAGPGGSGGEPSLGQNYRSGGKIKHTTGPKVGKDDGLIPAQRGEYVVRKSAVKKLGERAMSTINKGKLPQSRGR